MLAIIGKLVETEKVAQQDNQYDQYNRKLNNTTEFKNAIAECKMMDLPVRIELKRNSKPNLNNFAIGLYHQGCAFWGMGLDGYLLLLLEFQRVGFLKNEGKDNISMHTFLPCFLSFLFTSPFPFSLSFLFSSLGCYPLLHYGYCFYLYQAIPVGFLPFTPMAHQPFLFGYSATTNSGHAQYLLSPPLPIPQQVMIHLVLL